MTVAHFVLGARLQACKASSVNVCPKARGWQASIAARGKLSNPRLDSFCQRANDPDRADARLGQPRGLPLPSLFLINSFLPHYLILEIVSVLRYNGKTHEKGGTNNSGYANLSTILKEREARTYDLEV